MRPITYCPTGKAEGSELQPFQFFFPDNERDLQDAVAKRDRELKRQARWGLGDKSPKPTH